MSNQTVNQLEKNAANQSLSLLDKKSMDLLTIKSLFSYELETPVGRLLCVTDDSHLFLLEFMDKAGLERELKQLEEHYQAKVIEGKEVSKIMVLVKDQLNDYFTGRSTSFDVPLRLTGTAFQKNVWQQLLEIPYGKVASYLEIARQLGDPHLVRAIGGANGANKIAIIIPCHRVIASSGSIGGYSGGVERKQWLLELEGAP